MAVLNPDAPPFYASSSYLPPPHCYYAASTYYFPATAAQFPPLPPPPVLLHAVPRMRIFAPPHKLIVAAGATAGAKPQAKAATPEPAALQPPVRRGRSRGRSVLPDARGRARSPSPQFTTRPPAPAPAPPPWWLRHAITTVMVRNIPNRLSRAMMIQLLDNHCASMNKTAAVAGAGAAALSEYDFLYVPMDFRRRCNLGYAFVNFTTAEAARRLYGFLHRCRWKVFDSKKVIHVCSARLQGLDELVKNFKHSSFACDTGDFLPAVFAPPRNGATARPGPTVVGSLARFPS